MDIQKDKNLEIFFKDKDYTEIKTINGDVSLREFISGMLSYNPGWLAYLYKIRTVFVKVLGLETSDVPENFIVIHPDEISFNKGENAAFFIVNKALENSYWVCETPEDRHLKAYLGVVREKSGKRNSVFHVFTTIDYLHWTGPVYFNLIRFFHHLVVKEMMKAGVRYLK